MTDWLIGHKYLVYLVLAAAVLVTFALWWRARKRHYLIALGVAAVLLLGMVVLDRSVETDGEQMVRKVKEVAAAVTANDMDAAFAHVSENFNRPPRNKRDFRRLCDDVRKTGRVTEVVVWDLTPADVSPAAVTGNVEFRFKVRGSWGETPGNHLARVDFVRDPDRQWRIKSFDVFDSIQGSKTPLGIPGW